MNYQADNVITVLTHPCPEAGHIIAEFGILINSKHYLLISGGAV